jgi:GH25 family lysozyme M1 (1,4-beta-N-acetylmuramidase)
MKRAIDVSRWQGQINWPAVRASGVAGAWIKVGGSDGGLYADGMGAVNCRNAEASGLPWGTYYFAKPQAGQGVAQARHAVSAGHGQGRLWPTLDLEMANGLGGPALDAFALDFCAEVRRLTGKTSIIYTGAWIGTSGSCFGYTRNELAAYPLWIANYGANRPGTTPPAGNPPIPSRWGHWDIWQFNSVTAVPGIAGDVDQDVVTDSLWAQMLSGVSSGAPMESAPAASEELFMLHPIHVQGDNTQYFLFIDGNGVPRRVPIPSQPAASVLMKAGAIADQGQVVTLTDGAEIDYFNSILVSNEQAADIGALRLAILNIEQTKKSADQIMAAVTSDSGGATASDDYNIEDAANAAVQALTETLVRGSRQ